MTGDPPVLDVRGVSKNFGKQVAVRDVSFDVEAGHVLGIVGPNGAGKTTSIRMALGIVEPDRGAVQVHGSALTQQARERIGYLPEERGLYERRSALDTVAYLGELKGLAPGHARKKAFELLDNFGLGDHTHKKPGELSHGMGQLVQLAATIVHEPDLIVLDEPFTAFDPVNVRRLKQMVRNLRSEGAAIVLCTHQMNQVEELCDDVVMLNEGSVALAGPVDQVRRQQGLNVVRVVADPPPDDLEGVAEIAREGNVFSLTLTDGVRPDDLLRQLVGRAGTVERFEVDTPSLEEIFVSVVSS